MKILDCDWAKQTKIAMNGKEYAIFWEKIVGRRKYFRFYDFVDMQVIRPLCIAFDHSGAHG